MKLIISVLIQSIVNLMNIKMMIIHADISGSDFTPSLKTYEVRSNLKTTLQQFHLHM